MNIKNLITHNVSDDAQHIQSLIKTLQPYNLELASMLYRNLSSPIEKDIILTQLRVANEIISHRKQYSHYNHKTLSIQPYLFLLLFNAIPSQLVIKLNISFNYATKFDMEIIDTLWHRYENAEIRHFIYQHSKYSLSKLAHLPNFIDVIEVDTRKYIVDHCAITSKYVNHLIKTHNFNINDIPFLVDCSDESGVIYLYESGRYSSSSLTVKTGYTIMHKKVNFELFVNWAKGNPKMYCL